MDNVKISELESTTSATENDLLAIETQSGTKSIKVGKLLSGVYDILNDCFQFVSNGKRLVASAITDKGVETASDATFAVMAENIRNIPSGGVSYIGIATGVSVVAYELIQE